MLRHFLIEPGVFDRDRGLRRQVVEGIFVLPAEDRGAAIGNIEQARGVALAGDRYDQGRDDTLAPQQITVFLRDTRVFAAIHHGDRSACGQDLTAQPPARRDPQVSQRVCARAGNRYHRGGLRPRIDGGNARNVGAQHIARVPRNGLEYRSQIQRGRKIPVDFAARLERARHAVEGLPQAPDFVPFPHRDYPTKVASGDFLGAFRQLMHGPGHAARQPGGEPEAHCEREDPQAEDQTAHAPNAGPFPLQGDAQPRDRAPLVQYVNRHGEVIHPNRPDFAFLHQRRGRLRCGLAELIRIRVTRLPHIAVHQQASAGIEDHRVKHVLLTRHAVDDLAQRQEVVRHHGLNA